MTTATQSESLLGQRVEERKLKAVRRRAQLGEWVVGLLFVAPVIVIAAIFELFPVVYGFYLSMQDGVNVPEGFVGLEHFVQAVGSLAYMIALLIAVVFALGGYIFYRRGLDAMSAGGGNFYPYLLPGFITGPAALIGFGAAFRLGVAYSLIPVLALLVGFTLYAWLNARPVRQTQKSTNLTYVLNSWGVGLSTIASVLLLLFTFSELHRLSTPVLDILRAVIPDARVAYVFPLFEQFLAFAGTAAAVGSMFMISHILRPVDRDLEPGKHSRLVLARWLLGMVAVLLVVYVLGAQEALRASIASLANVTPEQLREVTRLRLPALVDRLSIWSQVYTMLLGIGLIGLAYYVWSRARQRETTGGMLGTIVVAILLMVGGWLFIGELPTAAASGDPTFYNSLLRTVTYAALTVPVQLGLGLLLAYLLFYEVRRGKSLYRLIYFMPYIAPTVATAAVFTIIFSNRETAPVNLFLQSIGLPPQQWLRNPEGAFQILAEIIGGPGTQLPSFLVGPSLPLLAAILYSIWVFSGYNAVVFMAGLGNIPAEIYEAAQVDGAGRWAVFRKIIFPMISPTTFFLTVLAVIGTFRAFTHIWVLRTADARGAMDTTTVYIYETILTASVLKTRPYAAALSFLLFGIILILTLVQNRLSRDRVFYG